MYKLKISKGQVIRINDRMRSGLQFNFEYGVEYPQHLLETFYNAGFKFVTKTKDNAKTKGDTES